MTNIPIDRESVEVLAQIFSQERDAFTAKTLLALRAALDAMEEGLTAVHMAGYMDGKKAGSISATPTDAQVNDACLSYDHSFGLMDAEQADALRLKAKKWWRCIARAALQENPDG